MRNRVHVGANFSGEFAEQGCTCHPRRPRTNFPLPPLLSIGLFLQSPEEVSKLPIFLDPRITKPFFASYKKNDVM